MISQPAHGLAVGTVEIIALGLQQHYLAALHSENEVGVMVRFIAVNGEAFAFDVAVIHLII